jgi:hypothetical protein
MYDPIADDMMTMSGAAKRAGEDRGYAELGRQVAEQSKLESYAAPVAAAARNEGRMEGAAELIARIEAQRAAELERVQSQGLAGYFNEEQGMR